MVKVPPTAPTAVHDQSHPAARRQLMSQVAEVTNPEPPIKVVKPHYRPARCRQRHGGFDKTEIRPTHTHRW